MQQKIVQWLYIGAGGALGTLLRGGISEAITTPFATLFVNSIGSLLLGGMTAYLYIHSQNKGHLIFGIGFCGSFTTMSMFAADATQLWMGETYIDSMAYIGGSVISGILLAFFGFYILKQWLEKRVSQ
ncbi:fluoride efflux transporter FluC [Tenuibacillus multivorans]|uniref:Fluoride-specific ion channel FluC n=1 Tax=Tenuibacillus multivorans TaxID=237069 RepID=A0A1H0E1Y3_9BACI|nr:CrcB family protein [Tenuibacillus multivorans]GEL76690.1 putative fluoride ion transporter CrcB 1 [Tenuibacillus multivorans]SDN76283.1 CrcB protein [Tenuibacillus multivorans]